jgi:hypothetical protein
LESNISKNGTALTIALDQVVVENTLLAAIIVGSIYFIINDLENKLRFIQESHQYKDYKPFFTNMWDAVILSGRHSLLPFEIFEDLQHTYSWMKYYNTELDVNKRDEGIFEDLLNEVKKSVDQSLKNLTDADK